MTIETAQKPPAPVEPPTHLRPARWLVAGLLAIAAVIGLAVISHSSSPSDPETPTPATSVTASAADELSTARQYADGPVTKVAAHIYKRNSDGLLLGPCSAVRPYVAEHGKPHGFFCW